jgi:hypothetical protein
VILFGVMYLNRAAMRLGSPVTLNTAKAAILGTPSGSASSASYTAGADGVVEVPLTIENTKFSPANLQIPADKPVRLVVNRKEDNACSAQLSIPQLGVTVDLKPNAVTNVDLPASKAGQYTLTCGMGMMSGSLSVGTGVASSGAESPIPWALLTFASAGGALWFGRNLKRADHPVRARGARAAAVAGFTKKQLSAMTLLVAFAALLGILLGNTVH